MILPVTTDRILHFFSPSKGNPVALLFCWIRVLVRKDRLAFDFSSGVWALGAGWAEYINISSVGFPVAIP